MSKNNKFPKRSDGLKTYSVPKFTMKAVIETTFNKYPTLEALKIYNKENTTTTYKQLKEKVNSFSQFLIKKGFKKEDKMAILGDSCPNWLISYFGITLISCIAIPILPGFSKQEVEKLLNHSDAKGIVVSSKLYDKISDLQKEKDLTLIRMEDLFFVPQSISQKLVNNNDFSNAAGNDVTKQEISNKDLIEIENREPLEDDIASLIYTSGTTGQPKGVILSHKNIVWNADTSINTLTKGFKKGYQALSILPISHIYEFTIGQIAILMKGFCINYLCKIPSASVLLPALRDVRPHVLLTVPLLIEKIYKNAIKPKLDTLKKSFLLSHKPIYPLIAKIIGRKLIRNFGGRIKFFGIGGAPLDPEVEKFLYDAKFPYAIGYGLTETSPFIAGTPVWDHKYGYTGKVMKGVTLRLANINPETKIGEIEVKSPSVTRGYYKNDELNKEAFTQDGYFRTGDLGYLNKKGYLALKGRSKTMILGSGGENIYPESIENVINNQEFVEESLVLPANGGLLALIKLDMEGYAKSISMSIENAKAEAKKYLQKIRLNTNKELSSFNRIDEVELQEEPFQRTPTQKIKRFLYSRSKSKENKKDNN